MTAVVGKAEYTRPSSLICLDERIFPVMGRISTRGGLIELIIWITVNACDT